MKGSLKLAVCTAALYGATALFSQAAYYSPQAGGPQHVVIDKGQQMLRAYQGNQVVFESRVSTGKQGKRTPSGRFHAQSKSLMHYSRLYGNAPMPYSVQVGGNYFIHGFSSVPHHPASHGCIRMPIPEAQQFYQWVRPGTPVDIVGQWKG